MTRHLGLDLGGTNIKLALLERKRGRWRTLADASAATEAERGPAHVLRRLTQVGAEAGRVDSVGVTVPGLFDPERGTVQFLPNLPGAWKGQPVVEPLRQALGAPTAMINDARAFALAESRLGAGRDVDTAVFVVIGTGIGGGIVVDGRLHLGLDGAAGEFGHQMVLPEGPACGCGSSGCVEALASGPAIAAAAGRATAEDVVEAARAGEVSAATTLARAGTFLGVAIANAIVLLSPERVVVGGGVAAAGELLLEPARAEIRRRVHVSPVERIAIVPAELGVLAGAIGAAIWSAERLGPTRLGRPPAPRPQPSGS